MADPIPLFATEPAATPGRNLSPAATDLFHLLSSACDQAAGEVVARGVALNVLFDPVLRQRPALRPLEAARAVKSMIAAMVRLANRGALTVRGRPAPAGLDVLVEVAGPFHEGQRPDPELFRQAAESVRDLGGRMEVEQRDGRLALTVAFPAPPIRPSVLVVEQDWPGRQETAGAIHAAGFEVSTASDGPSALRALADGAPAAIIVDLYLEGEDALELARSLKAETGAPVYALVREGGSLSGWALNQAGFSGVLESPISYRALEAVLGGGSVEAAEFETVQAGEDGEEGGDGQDRDHRVLRSAVG